jgi:hypothetical protein
MMWMCGAYMMPSFAYSGFEKVSNIDAGTSGSTKVAPKKNLEIWQSFKAYKALINMMKIGCGGQI